MRLVFAILCTFLISSLSALSWETDHELAIQKARDNNKGVIILFTGSDWCPWCKKIESQIFSRKEFAEKTKEHFIFLKLDFPHRKLLSRKQKEKNAALQRKYKVRGFPTVLIVDPEKGMVKRLGYMPVGPEKYSQILIESYQSYKDISSQLEKKNLSKKDRKSLQDRAEEMGLDSLLETIVR